MNAFVIALNQGMPYRVPEGEKVETTVKHRPGEARRHPPRARRLHRARDRRSNASISFGDLVIAVGLVDLTFRASRRSPAVPPRSTSPDDEITLEQSAVPPTRRASTSRGRGGRGSIFDTTRTGSHAPCST